MTVAQFLKILRSQWLVVVLVTLLAVGGATAYALTRTPVYEARTQLFVSVTGGSQSDISQLQQGSTFTQQRVKSYADVAMSPDLAAEVIDRLGLDTTPVELSKRIRAENPLDTVLLDITVQAPTATGAVQLADAVALDFPLTVDRLETPGGRSSAQSPVKVSITERPTLPDAPVSPRIPLSIAIGLLLGLGLGTGAALLRAALNTSVGGVADLERITGSVPLGVVPFDPQTTQQPVISTSELARGRSEAFRTLRTNLQFANIDDPPRVIVVTSSLPGEGKSVTACNVALTLAMNGARVVLIEGDLRKPAVGTYLGIDSAAGLTHVLTGRHELRDVLVPYAGILSVLPAGPTPPNPSELLGSQQMANLLGTLAGHYDSVVIDAPPLLPVTDAAVLSALADGALLVARHGKIKREQVERSVQALRAVNATLIGTVLNGAPVRRRKAGYDGYGYGYGYGPTTASPEFAAPAPAAPPAAPPPGQRRQGTPPGAIELPAADPVGRRSDPAPVAPVRDRAATPPGSTPVVPDPAAAPAAATPAADIPWEQVLPAAAEGGGRRRGR